MVSTLSNTNPMLKGMNLETLMKTSNSQQNLDQNVLSNLNLVSGLNPSAAFEEDSGE